MGAFKIDEVKLIIEHIGFEVYILECNFDQIQNFSYQKNRGIFVARKK